MSAYCGPEIVNSGLILYLDAANTKSYPGSGTTWFDLSENSNNFTLNGTLTHSATQGFSGFSQNNRWYRNSFPANLKTGLGGNGLTTCVWAKCTGTGTWQKLIGNGDEQNYIDLYAYSGSGIYHQEDGSTLYYNAGVSVSGSLYMADSVWRMYISTNLNGGTTANPTDAFGIGSEGDGLRNYPWIGNIMSVFIYNRVLSTAEMSQNFQALRSRFGI